MYELSGSQLLVREAGDGCACPLQSEAVQGKQNPTKTI